MVSLPVFIERFCQIFDEAYDILRDCQKMTVIDDDDAPGAPGLARRYGGVFEQSALHEFFLATVCACDQKIRLPFENLLRIDFCESLDPLLRTHIDCPGCAH